MIVAGETDTVATVTEPASATVCGLCGALSEMLIDAVRLDDPVAEGSNFTVITQDALTPRLCGQLFVSIKSVGFVPFKMIPDIPSEVVPGLDKVTFCGELAVPAGWAPNVRLEAESVIADATAVPVNDTVCGLPAALSLRLRLALFVPLDDGEKFIVTVQLAADASVPLEGQGLLPAGTIPKLLAPLPLTVIPEMFSVPLPWFTTVTVWFPLVLPTACAANASAVGDMFKSGAAGVAVPVNGIVCTAPDRFPELSVIFTAALNVPVADGVKVMLTPQLTPGDRLLGHVSADSGN